MPICHILLHLDYKLIPIKHLRKHCLGEYIIRNIYTFYFKFQSKTFEGHETFEFQYYDLQHYDYNLVYLLVSKWSSDQVILEFADNLFRFLQTIFNHFFAIQHLLEQTQNCLSGVFIEVFVQYGIKHYFQERVCFYSFVRFRFHSTLHYKILKNKVTFCMVTN